MRPITGLTVIECKYLYDAWSVEVSNGEPVFTSSVREMQHREMVTYRQSGIYDDAGVPVTIREIDYEAYKDYEPYEGITRNFSDEVCQAVQKGDAVMVAGGYCNYAPAVAGGIQRAIGTDKILGIIWLDAHTDCRVPGHSSGNLTRLVSVPLSTLTGLADETLLTYRTDICGLAVPCRGENIIASDTRIMDEESANNFVTANILRLDASDFQRQDVWQRHVKALAERVDAIYMSIDADILEYEYVPSYIKKVPYGQNLDTVMRNVGIVTETGKVCALSLFCFNFDCSGKESMRTYKSAVDIMQAGLSKWKQVPLG